MSEEICGAELKVFVGALLRLENLGGCSTRILGLLDNDGATGIFIRGFCRSRSTGAADLSACAEEGWSTLERLASSIWVERVGSLDSPADAPSRGAVQELHRGWRGGSWENLQVAIGPSAASGDSAPQGKRGCVYVAEMQCCCGGRRKERLLSCEFSCFSDDEDVAARELL